MKSDNENFADKLRLTEYFHNPDNREKSPRDGKHECFRSSHPEVFLRKGVLKICRKFIGEHPCQNVISIKLLCNFIEITLQHGCSPENFLHIFRTPFPKNTAVG